jgi:hypothetical protein
MNAAPSAIAIVAMRSVPWASIRSLRGAWGTTDDPRSSYGSLGPCYFVAFWSVVTTPFFTVTL